MSIAQQVVAACKDTAAFTLYGGYAQTYGGKTNRFPTGHEELCKRNDNGRCIHSRTVYADGSRVEYRYKGDGDYSLSAIPAKS